MHARPPFPVDPPGCLRPVEGAVEPAPDSAYGAAGRAPVTYFRVICLRGLLALAACEAIEAEPSRFA